MHLGTQLIPQTPCRECGGKGQNHPSIDPAGKMSHLLTLTGTSHRSPSGAGKIFYYFLSRERGQQVLLIGLTMIGLFLGPAPPRWIGRSMAVYMPFEYQLILILIDAGRGTVGVLSVRAVCNITHLSAGGEEHQSI
jgi:hypothetical protein